MSYEAWNAGRLPPGATTTASANSAPKTLTVEDLKRLERELALMPKPQWALIAPDGRTWMDADPQALLRVLAVFVFTHGVTVAPHQPNGHQPPMPSPLGEG